MTSSEEISKRDRKQDVDGGYAWAILAGCFLMYMIVVGGLKAYGVLYVEMILVYERGSGNTAWIGGICILLTLGGGPVANLLSRRFSFRSVSFVGGLLVSVGFISSAFVPNMDYMFFTLGGLVGVGYSLAFAPCSTIISFYFEERRALANGITVSASGIGALIFPFAYKFLIETYGLSRTFFILGAFVLNICAAACFFRQPRELVLEKKRMWKRTGSSKTPDHKSLLNGNSHIKRSESELTRENSCCRGFFDGLFKCSLFCNPLFLMYVIAFVLCMNGYGPSVIQIPGHLQLLGYDNFHVAIALATMGGCEVVARIAFGWLADKGYLKRRHIFIFSMSVAGVFSLIAPLFKNFYFYVGYAAIMGIFPGSFWSLISVLIIDVVGMKDFTAAFGLVSLCLALGSAITQPSMGWLTDYTGSWNSSFLLTGCLLLASACVAMFEPLIKETVKRRRAARATAQERRTLDMMPVRFRRSKSTLSLTVRDVAPSPPVEEGVDVTLTSRRISRIYRPVETEEDAPSTPDRSSAPTADITEV